MKEYGPDGPEGMPLGGAFDDGLDSRFGDPEPDQSDDGLHDDDDCRDLSN